MSESSKTISGWPGWARSLAFGLCLLPPAMLAMLVWRNAVNVPYWDEWDDDIAGLFIKFSDGTLTFGDLWAQHNESRFVLPRLIFLALGQFTHWNLCYEMGLTFLLISVVAGAVFCLGRRTFAGQPAIRWSVFFIASLLLFTPAQYEALLWGMEFILYLPLVCILISLLLWQTALSERTKIILSAGLALISTYSFSNGLLVWIVLFPILFLSGGWAGLRQKIWLAVGWLLTFFTNVALYFHNFQFPAASGFWHQLWNAPWVIVEYFLAFLGAPLVVHHIADAANYNSYHAVDMSVIIGGILLVIFVGAIWLAFRRRQNAVLAAPAWLWLTLGGYGLLSALLATTGRFSMGAEQAMSSRYAIFSICSIVALVHLVPLLAIHQNSKQITSKPRPMAAIGLPAMLGATVVLLHLFTIPAAIVSMSATRLNRLQAKSYLKFLDVLPPQPAARTTLYLQLRDLKHRADILSQHGWLDYALLRTHHVSGFKQNQPPSQPIGIIEHCEITGTNLFVYGWALSATHHTPADCILFSYESEGAEPAFFALFDSRLVRPDLVEKSHDQAYTFAGWEKTAQIADLPKGTLNIKCWVYDAEDDTITPLPGDIDLKNN